MKRQLVLSFLFLLLSSPAYALTLSWQPVTLSTTGAPLGPGFEVTEYRVYRCDIVERECTRAEAKLVATVKAPSTSLDITNISPQPPRYFVTAKNVVTEGAGSSDLKLGFPISPKALSLK